MALLKDVAKVAGVSIATASYVLNESKSLSPDVEKRVWDAARALKYRPNRSAQALRTGRHNIVGLVVPDLTNPYFPALARAVEKRARENELALLLLDTNDDPEIEREAFRLLEAYQVTGVIWVPIHEQTMQRSTRPVVVVDRPVNGFDTVYADHFQGGVLLAELALTLGHRRVGILAGPQTTSSAIQRRKGFFTGACSLLEVAWEVQVPFSPELPDEAVDVLARRDAVTLVLAANDAVAGASIRALHQRRISVPEEVSVVGFDDVPWASWIEPPLTTVRQPLEAIGARAVQLLLDRLAKPEAPIKTEVLPVELVERASAAAVADPIVKGSRT